MKRFKILNVWRTWKKTTVLFKTNPLEYDPAHNQVDCNKKESACRSITCPYRTWEKEFLHVTAICY